MNFLRAGCTLKKNLPNWAEWAVHVSFYLQKGHRVLYFIIGDLGFYKDLLKAIFTNEMFGTFFVCQERLSTSVYSSQTKRREWRIKFHKRLIHSSLWRLRIQVTGFFNSFFLLLENFFFCPLWWLMMGWAPEKKGTKKIEIKQNIVFIFDYLWGGLLGAKFSSKIWKII